MQVDTANRYQFLYHVILVVSLGIFFADFTDAKLVTTHKNGKTSFYTLIIRSFLNFPPTPQICSAERICEISGSF